MIARGKRRLLLASVLGVFCVGSAPSADAGVTYVSQSARDSSGATTVRGGDSVSDVDSSSAPGRISLQTEAVGGDGTTFISRARSRTEVTLDQSGIRLTDFDAVETRNLIENHEDGSIFASTDTEFSTEFTLDSAYTATFTTGGEGTGSLEGVEQLALLKDGKPLYQLNFGFSFPDDEFTLEPGSYGLAYTNGRAAAFGPRAGESTFTFDLSFAPVPGGGGNTPPAVPLPPAVWVGLSTLGGIAVAQYRRRRAAALTA